MFDVAIYSHVSGPAHAEASYVGYWIENITEKGVTRQKRLPLVFTGKTPDEVQAKAEAQYAADVEREARRDSSIRAAAEARRAKRGILG